MGQRLILELLDELRRARSEDSHPWAKGEEDRLHQISSFLGYYVFAFLKPF